MKKSDPKRRETGGTYFSEQEAPAFFFAFLGFWNTATNVGECCSSMRIMISIGRMSIWGRDR
jgi:hypothetical protein